MKEVPLQMQLGSRLSPCRQQQNKQQEGKMENVNAMTDWFAITDLKLNNFQTRIYHVDSTILLLLFRTPSGILDHYRSFG